MLSGRRRPGLAEPHPRQPKPRGVTEMVTAVDDDMWKTDVNATMWQNARYLTWNDKGSGTLKVTSVAGKSSAGGSVTFGSDGTIKYTPVAGWQGKDSTQYTVQDGLGATDTGVFHIQDRKSTRLNSSH